MKSLITALLAVSTLVSQAATLVWDDPNPTGYIASYRVYRITGPGEYDLLATVTDKAWPIDLPPLRNSVTATAVTYEGLESEPAVPFAIYIPKTVDTIRLQIDLTTRAASLVWNDTNDEGTIAAYVVYKQLGPDAWLELGRVTAKEWAIVLPKGDNVIAITAIATDAMGGMESYRSDPRTLSVPKPVTTFQIVK